MYVRYAGRKTADDVILDLVSEAAMQAGGSAGADGVVVVTNDRDLRSRVLVKGSRTVPLQWLIERMRLPVLASPAAGNRKPTIASGAAAGAGGPYAKARDEDDRTPWKPGRGATSKTGPAKRVARHKRHPRMGT
jgi:hypothetical protein